MTTSSRRDFLVTAAAAAPAVGVLAASTQTAQAQLKPAMRTAFPGPEGAPFSRATTFGPMAFMAGVMGTKPGGRELESASFEAECKQAMDNLKASVEAAGATMANVMKCTCFLTNSGDFETFNKVYRTYFPANPPARSTVVVKELVLAGARIEIDCTAVLL